VTTALRILLVNPPNCGRSIPEERYGITSMRQIFRGEPLALETLAGNLDGHDVRIVDLKAEPQALPVVLKAFEPNLVGLTAVTCEANTVLRLSAEIKDSCRAVVVVGGVHATNDPSFFDQPCVDYVVVGLGKASFAELVTALEVGAQDDCPPGVACANQGGRLSFSPRSYTSLDLVEAKPPRYDLVASYRSSYVLSKLGIRLGFVASAFGCPFTCDFCCIEGLTGGRYLTQSVASVLRDIALLDDLPVIRLVDANSFGNVPQARALAEAILAAGLRKHFLVDVRSDTVVRHPELMRLWKQAGLRSVVIGFEEVSQDRLDAMNKSNSVSTNDLAIDLLHDLGITIVGDFIVSPDYDERQFDALGAYVRDRGIDLPMLTVLTPLPGTPLHARMRDQIAIHDLDYYTLTNAVVPTRLPEQRFYERYAGLLDAFHSNAKI
jgi:hopanoid C-3 methylase